MNYRVQRWSVVVFLGPRYGNRKKIKVLPKQPSSMSTQQYNFSYCSSEPLTQQAAGAVTCGRYRIFVIRHVLPHAGQIMIILT